jgi:hypothetical protein
MDLVASLEKYLILLFLYILLANIVCVQVVQKGEARKTLFLKA